MAKKRHNYLNNKQRRERERERLAAQAQAEQELAEEQAASDDLQAQAVSSEPEPDRGQATQEQRKTTHGANPSAKQQSKLETLEAFRKRQAAKNPLGLQRLDRNKWQYRLWTQEVSRTFRGMVRTTWKPGAALWHLDNQLHRNSLQLLRRLQREAEKGIAAKEEVSAR